MIIVTGCNAKYEFLIEPFFHFLRLNNPDVEVRFADFGLSEAGKTLVSKYTQSITQYTPKGPHVYDTLMLKPLALRGIADGLWLDIDVQVIKSLEPLRHVSFGAQRNTVTWNTGCLKFVAHPVIDLWGDLERTEREHDEHVLIRASKIHPIKMKNFDWRIVGGWEHYHRKASIMYHWMGQPGKNHFKRSYAKAAKQVVVPANGIGNSIKQTV